MTFSCPMLAIGKSICLKFFMGILMDDVVDISDNFHLRRKYCSEECEYSIHGLAFEFGISCFFSSPD